MSTVKIDRSFVTGVDGSLADPVIIEAVTRLSHTLGLRVVAEGVEELAQAEALIELNIDELQGFYFARPLDARGVRCRDRRRDLVGTHSSSQRNRAGRRRERRHADARRSTRSSVDDASRRRRPCSSGGTRPLPR